MHTAEQTLKGVYSVGGSSRKILDTAELFHTNLAIDDIMFQEYPEPKEKSSESGIWPR